MQDLAALRKEYTQASLDVIDVLEQPLDQFTVWFDQALKSGVEEPNAMVLSTLSPNGRPTSRVVLVKGVSERGLIFFTNYGSAKGQALAAQPWASLLFFWPALERQVRIEGCVEKISPAESDTYYKSRPLGSRIGAWASPQSQAIDSRQWLADQFAHYESSLGQDPPRPEDWGGYLLVPDRMEFWQGRASRLHDRVVYLRSFLTESVWQIQRLAP